ncbi:MAG TPA: right-handed parallel beta-helix repeat-containing protein [Thermoanaerobaculia bacterium]|nr:right-handed parallel beta-helix repeat-containing protein [Thermoanaerobaculia bacterium]
MRDQTTRLILAALMAALVCGIAGRLRAQETEVLPSGDKAGWYIVKTGDTLEGITQRFLGSPRWWRENWKLNPDIKDPHKLHPGQRIKIILSRNVIAKSAEVKQVARHVDKKPAPASWLPATVGDKLQQKDGLRTLEKSSAAIGFDDGAGLVLTENSLIFLREPPPVHRDVPRDSIEIIDGQADLETHYAPAHKSGIQVIVSGATTKPKSGGGAQTQTRARNDKGSAQFMVYKGEAAVEAAGKSVVVPKGMGTAVPPGGAPGKPEKLLEAPQPVEPLAGATLAASGSLRWKPVESAASYVVEVCRDMVCASLADRAVGVTTTAWEPHSLPSGKLYWRVTAKAASGLDGFPSAPVEFAGGKSVNGRVVAERDASGAADGRPGVSVKLYRDGGDGLPNGADDVLAGETRTRSDGTYSIGVGGAGTYWIAVDSRSVTPSARLMSPGAEVWPEQTRGPIGGLCADGRGGTRELSAAGPCFGGRRAGVSDDARDLATSEHVARVVAGSEDVDGIDFGFSFDVVTTVRDGDDDMASAGRSVQGSLRQFVSNANAISGPNAMRFVPVEAANAASGEAKWWSIALAATLPDIIDSDTAIDGAVGAMGGGPASPSLNPGTINAAVTVGRAATALQPVDRPQLEVLGPARGRNVFLTRGRVSIRGMALSGALAAIETYGPLELENVTIGTRADGAAGGGGVHGLTVLDRSTTRLRRVFITGQKESGILVESPSGEARIDAENLEVTACGLGSRTGDGISLHSDSSAIRHSYIHDNRVDESAALGGSGIEIWADGSAQAPSADTNVIEECTIAHHRTGVIISTSASGNTLRGNVISDTGGSAVTVNSFKIGIVPARNRLIGNDYSRIGGTAVEIEGNVQIENDAGK